MLQRCVLGLALAAALAPAIVLAAPPPAGPKKEVRAPSNLPSNAELTSRAATAAGAKPSDADWRTPDPNMLLVIDTNKGRIIVELYPILAPAHVAQIQALAKRHFFDGQTFFRVIDDFMDQTGDPTNTGTGGSDLPNLKAEFSFKRTAATPWVSANAQSGVSAGFIGAMPVASQAEDLMAMTSSGAISAWPLYCAGVAAMARAEDPDSANSQFFLMRGPFPALTHKYTAWGRVLIGQDVVNLIKTGEPVEKPQDQMVTVRLASDMPEADRPKVQVIDTASRYFRARMAKILGAPGYSVCDVTVEARLVS
jgi:peptidylprolyl isomerase